MKLLFRLAGQGAAYFLFAAVIGLFSAFPAYAPLPAGQAVVKLSFSHLGRRKVECRVRSAEELRNMPPNMRAPLDCPRARHPVSVQLTIDGRQLYRATVRPSGIVSDGHSLIYQKFPVAAGRHRIAIRLEDGPPGQSTVHSQWREVELAEGEILVVGFNKATDRFHFK